MTLLYPVIAMATLTYATGAFLFFTRVTGIRAGKISMKYFRTYNEGTSTPLETKASQHFTNLFEVPVLFYAAAAFALILGMESPGMVISAWVFLLSRVAHAIAHIGPNRLFPRMISFFTGVFASMAMWGMVAAEVLRRG